MKNSKISIAKLNSIFTDPLQKFDLMHKQMTGEEIVITSANDGKHMKGSKHYTNDAIDVRRWAYDKLDTADQIRFTNKLEVIFLKRDFDIVYEYDHFHIEFDPKPHKDIPEPRIKTDKEVQAIIQEITDGITPTPAPYKLPKPKFNFSTFELINWKIIPRALINGAFRYFTKFNLFLQAHRPSWIDKLIELLRTLINKLTKKGK